MGDCRGHSVRSLKVVDSAPLGFGANHRCKDKALHQSIPVRLPGTSALGPQLRPYVSDDHRSIIVPEEGLFKLTKGYPQIGWQASDVFDPILFGGELPALGDNPIQVDSV
jgi:hypothetical protein